MAAIPLFTEPKKSKIDGEVQVQEVVASTSKKTSASSHTQCTSHLFASKVLKNLNRLRDDGSFCDVKIVAGGLELQAHRAVLSAGSPYFQAMFTAGLSEQQQNTIELHSVSGQILTALINFIYTGEINVSQENVQEMIVAADMLQLFEVVSTCTSFLKNELHPSNAIGIFRFSEGHHCPDLELAAVEYIHCNFPRIYREEEFVDLPKELLIDFISSEHLRVDSEFQVFEAVMLWIQHDVNKRRCYVFEVLSYVRLPLLSLVYLDRAINECADSSLKIALRSVKSDLVSRKGNLVPLVVKPRLCAKKNIFLIGGSKRELISTWTRASGCSTFSTVERFDTFKGEWHKAAPMRLGRVLPGVTTLDGKIFVIGGEEESQILANGECYDPRDNTWAKMASMVVPRCEFGLCALDGLLYAVGGWVGEDIGGSIEMYDPVIDEWKLEGDLPEPLFSMGVVSYDGLIYIVGGCTHSRRHLEDLRSFNPVTGEWCVLPPMNVPRSQMGVAVLDKHLYVVGGTNREHEVLQSVERYSFEENIWTMVPQMTIGRACPAVSAADGILYVMGGLQVHEVNFWRAQVTIAAVECYDPLTGTWKECASLPESRGEAGAVVI